MPALNLIGSTLSSSAARPCGLCGDFRRLSKAHVPPQSAGNNARVLRAPDVIVEGVRRPGRWSEGGMWVRGLCEDCNNHAGNLYDVPYADFAHRIQRMSTPIARDLAVVRGQAPAVEFAPGLVSRAVMFGMFAINPRLRILFPELADDLKPDTAGSRLVRWPDKLALKLAQTHPRFPDQGVISSGVWAMRVMTERVVHWSFGDIVWPPLTWSLVPTHKDSERDGLGPQITKPLPNVSEWVRYGPDRTSVDLRSLTRELPMFAHPMLARSNDWVEMMASSDTDAGPVVLFGKR